MDDNKMKRLKEKYHEIPIPTELDTVVENSLQKRNSKKFRLHWGVGLAAAAVIFTTSLNLSPTLAKSLEDVPVVGSIVHILTIKEYNVDEGNYQADIQVPAVEIENEDLEQRLNTKYLQESQELYDTFIKEMEAQQAFDQGGHLSVDSGYVIKTDTDQILSVGRYVEEIVASSMTTIQYDTIDKQNELLVTLPSLFKDNSYIEVISENITNQMKQQMEEDPYMIYWIESSDNIVSDIFTEISINQNFYINADNQLVISFNEYEVAPGYMGTVEFVIPTEKLQDILVSNEYLK